MKTKIKKAYSWGYAFFILQTFENGESSNPLYWQIRNLKKGMMFTKNGNFEKHKVQMPMYHFCKITEIPYIFVKCCGIIT